jgi:hypothetical protein
MNHGWHGSKTARAIPATFNQRVFTATVFNTAGSHPYNVKGGKSAGAKEVAQAAMNRALGNATRDMQKKIQKEMGKKYAIALANTRGIHA